MVLSTKPRLSKRINQDFFKRWTSEMSYILGYIVADGCIIKRKNRKESYTLNITSKDRDHLFRIRKSLDSDYSITLKRNSQGKIYYQIQFCNREICNDLINLGILPKKTFNLPFFDVTKEYFSDFTRGFFDGDGTVYIYRVNETPQIKAGFVSPNPSFITEFNKQLCRYLNILPKAVHKKIDRRGKRMIIYDICFYVDDCEKLANFMYKDNLVLCLPRKRIIFEKWESMKRRRYIKQNYPSKIGWRTKQKFLV